MSQSTSAEENQRRRSSEFQFLLPAKSRHSTILFASARVDCGIMDVEALASSPDALCDFARVEFEKLGKLIREVGIRVD